MKSGADLIREIEPHYRSGINDLGKDFFLPCLMHCKSYSRASGFFSSRVLLDWVEALPRITDPSETEIRLLIAPILSVDDVLALKQAVDEPTRSKLRQRKAADLIEGVLEATNRPARLY